MRLPPQKTANLIRLYLVSRYGGVWADADCYCVRPLDDWLPSHLDGGFFALRFAADEWLERNRDRPLARLFGRSTDRILSNWFLAGCAGNPVSTMFLPQHMSLFRQRKFRGTRLNKLILRLLLTVFRRNAYLASQLASAPILRIAGRFPYFIFHYDFARQILRDDRFHDAWRKVSRLDGVPSLAYSKTLHLPADEDFHRDFEGAGEVPVFKLHWKLQDGATSPNSRYRRLIDQRQD